MALLTRGFIFPCFVASMLWASVGMAADVDREVNDKRFHRVLLAAAQEHAELDRVDGVWHWSPKLCRTPPVAMARFSESKDDDTHGRKMYFLSAADTLAYHDAAKRDQPVGQVLVKAAWSPVLVKSGKAKSKFKFKNKLGVMVIPKGVPYAARDGKLYKAGKRHAYFIMLKLDAKTDGADQGWVYGTVTPDAKQVTSAGKVASCMACHQDAKRDRMFGSKDTDADLHKAIKSVEPADERKPSQDANNVENKDVVKKDAEAAQDCVLVKKDGKWVISIDPLKGTKLGDRVEVKVFGHVQTGINAIGGETTGTIITFNKTTWEVGGGNQPALRKVINELNKKRVEIHGFVYRKRGVEIRERTILKAKSITAATEK